VNGETGRWIRVSKRLRDELETTLVDDALASELVELWDTARPEDWIAQLEDLNRALVAENRRLLALQGYPPARRLA
jgi:predicted exporter